MSHNERRLMHHEGGYVDPQRLEHSRLSIGAAFGPCAGILGNPCAELHMSYPTARIIKFPAVC